jgi:Flp pilus assembly protein TadG
MAEPAPAKFGAPATDVVDIVYNASGYGPTPQNSSVANNGTVTFICQSRPSWVWTGVGNALVNAFVGETNNYIPCNVGSNGPYSIAPAYQNSTINIIPLAVNSNPPPPMFRDNLRGTIKVGSMIGKAEEKE